MYNVVNKNGNIIISAVDAETAYQVVRRNPTYRVQRIKD